MSPTHPALPDQPFTLTTALDYGITRRELRDHVDARRVVRVLRNVYQRSDLPDTPENRAAAVFVVLPPFAVVSDTTAAWIHGVDTFRYHELEIYPPVEIRVLRGFTRRRRSGIAGGVRDLEPRDVMQIGSITVTTPLRTALDLGCKLYKFPALAALDGFMRVHGLTQADFEGELPRYRRRRGVVQVRKLIAICSPLAESAGESWPRLALIEAGLPMPVLQFWVVHRGHRLFRLDLAYPKHLVCIEYDGIEFHDSEEQRRYDEARRAWLRSHGWIVIVVRREDFTPERISTWTDEVRDAVRTRSAWL